MLDLSKGDIIAIRGKSIAGAVFLPDENISDNSVRIDGLTRKNAGVEIGEQVDLVLVKSLTAHSVVLSLASQQILDIDSFTKYTKTILTGYPMVVGNLIMVPFDQGIVTLIVEKTDPDGIVVYGKNTVLSIYCNSD